MGNIKEGVEEIYKEITNEKMRELINEYEDKTFRAWKEDLTKEELIDYFDLNDEKNLKEEKKQKEEESNNIDALMKEKESYRKGYYILLSYFNSINDEEKKKVHKELKEVGL